MITALNLKYRPQKISQLDHKSAREALSKIFASGKIPPAFLFTGPKGIGKTSSARIVAKAVNCLKVTKEGKENKEFEPCGECSACVSITNGSNLDVLEIDGASNTGIDDIRELRDKVKLSPSSAKFKVYIIDEVHMLSNAAFNGLLKTLEEPPAHVIFILCTTAPEKLPETIISRCTRINFKKASVEEIKEKLAKISEAEKFSFSQEDLLKIAKQAEGSFRDAIKILEQAASSSVDEVLGIMAGFQPEELLEFLAQGKTKEAIVWLNQAFEQGINLRVLAEQILSILRLVLLKKYGVETEEVKDIPGFKQMSENRVKTLIELFTKASLELRTAVIPQLPLEIAVIAFAEEKAEEQKDDPSTTEGEADFVPKADLAGKDKEKNNEEQIAGVISPQAAATTLLNLEEILAKWSEILERVKPLNHSVQAFLRACRPIGADKGSMTLEVFYKFHKDKLESEKCRRIVEDVCSQVFCSPVKVKYTLGSKPVPIKIEKKEDPAEEKVDLENLEPSDKINSDQIDNENLIKMAEEIFNGGKIQ